MPEDVQNGVGRWGCTELWLLALFFRLLRKGGKEGRKERPSRVRLATEFYHFDGILPESTAHPPNAQLRDYRRRLPFQTPSFIGQPTNNLTIFTIFNIKHLPLSSALVLPRSWRSRSSAAPCTLHSQFKNNSSLRCKMQAAMQPECTRAAQLALAQLQCAACGRHSAQMGIVDRAATSVVTPLGLEWNVTLTNMC